MSVHSFLASAWQKAKCVWWWDGAAWQKAVNVFWFDGATWQQVYQRPDMNNSLAGATDSASAPATIVFTWTLIGQTYGATVELFAAGISWVQLDAEANPTGYTALAADPTQVWTAEVRDGNGDLIRTRTAMITGP